MLTYDSYPRFEHPGQPEMFVQPILASKPTNGAPPIFTLHMRYPRIIHGEVMTHRVFSRNARSSRAVPVKTMLNEVREKPFVPWHWGKNQKGMQAAEECNEPIDMEIATYDGDDVFTGYETMPFDRETVWKHASVNAWEHAGAYMLAGYHKQIPNRLLEPFSWIDTLVTSTSWANFLHLRDHKDAEPHFQDLARLVAQALEWIEKNGAFQVLTAHEWHMPYITPQDRGFVLAHLGLAWEKTDRHILEILKKVSAARCARISYTPFDGNPTVERELERYDHLVSSDRIHASPTEHQARPDTSSGEGFATAWENPHLAGNLGPGWVQFRKTLTGEYMPDRPVA